MSIKRLLLIGAMLGFYLCGGAGGAKAVPLKRIAVTAKESTTGQHTVTYVGRQKRISSRTNRLSSRKPGPTLGDPGYYRRGFGGYR
jgi:hypothetical protein